LTSGEQVGTILVMRRRFIVMGLAFALLTSATAMAAREKPLYRTQRQAELYLVHDLGSWAHVDLAGASLKAAFCIDGNYSKRQQRSGQHYPRGRVNRVGQSLFRSFACTLTLHVARPRRSFVDAHVYAPRVFYLYLVATRTGWRVEADD
jgi:hypothetical protein